MADSTVSREQRQKQYPWPTPPAPPAPAPPLWTGQGFRLGEQSVGVLSFQPGQSNWSDDLTAMHEDAAGSDHPIDRASRADAIAQLKRGLRRLGRSAPIILEVGCSSGFLLREMRAQVPQAMLIGSDFIAGPLEALHRAMPDLPLLQFDLVQCPLPDASIDAVVALNVLEHVEDHEGALRQIFRILRPGGVAVIEVPAGPHLFDVYDKLLMHWRRYRLGELVELARGCGFEVRRASHLGFIPYLPFARTKRRNQKYLKSAADVQQKVVVQSIQNSRTQRLLKYALAAETRLGRFVNYPVGIRCLMTCAKPITEPGQADNRAGPCRPG
jgi:ubiquinone/menaquinone biosynthesis C-methylase UbiE